MHSVPLVLHPLSHVAQPSSVVFPVVASEHLFDLQRFVEGSQIQVSPESLVFAASQTVFVG